MAAIYPYLNFSGKCEEAFAFYKSVFGGDYLMRMRYSDVPASEMDEDHQTPDSEAQNIMHVALPIGQGTILMGSDRPGAMGPTTSGNSYFVSINAESHDEAVNLFNGLSAGGQVIMPLEKAFWGADFGMFVDKFGVQWMVNYEYPQ